MNSKDQIMALKRLLKTVSISCRVYGPLKRAHRRLFDHKSLQQFQDNVALYAAFVAPGDLCFDVGSNVGEKTEAFLANGASVVAFEPQPSSFREMKARCSPNRRLTAINAAVGAAPGQLPMYISRRSGATSLVANWAQDVQEVTLVPVTTLDQAIVRYGLPSFCKIDVEGYELEVLKGLSHPLPCITLEYHLTEEDVQKVLDCVDYLSRFGELSMNITLGEEARLDWPEWIPYGSFQDYFPSRAPRSPTCGYGDLFVRIRSNPTRSTQRSDGQRQ
jgi:FkbM family methyltransferase